MDHKEISARIKLLKDLIKAQDGYNNLFTTGVIESKTLQDNLTFQQQPIIKAIEKIKPELKPDLKLDLESRIPFFPELDYHKNNLSDSIRPLLKKEDSSETCPH